LKFNLVHINKEDQTNKVEEKTANSSNQNDQGTDRSLNNDQENKNNPIN